MWEVERMAYERVMAARRRAWMSLAVLIGLVALVVLIAIKL